MSELLTASSALDPQETGSSASWSVGVIAPTGMQMPTLCLQHCLDGDTTLAETHGCAMLRSLIRKARTCPPWDDSDDAAPGAPPTCDRGYAVSLPEAGNPTDPIVLVLRPAVAGEQAAEHVGSATEALQSATQENWRLNQENNGFADEGTGNERAVRGR